MEAELFGYTPGAFTGAQKGGQQGSIEAANHGTLFLDEINSLPLSLQGKLLRVLETKLVKKIGAIEEQYVDFRLIVASNQDLFTLTQQGAFVKIFTTGLPWLPSKSPLCGNASTILSLWPTCFCRSSASNTANRRPLPAIATKVLKYSWPGNVRSCATAWKAF